MRKKYRLLEALSVAIALSACQGIGDTSVATTVLEEAIPESSSQTLIEELPCDQSERPVVGGLALPGTIVLGCEDRQGIVIPVLHATSENVTSIKDKVFLAAATRLSERERALGWSVAWADSGPTLRSVIVENGDVIIDITPEVKSLVISSTANSGPFFVPLVGTAFLEPTVASVLIVIDGNAETAKEWWESSKPLKWTRDEWFGIYSER